VEEKLSEIRAECRTAAEFVDIPGTGEATMVERGSEPSDVVRNSAQLVQGMIFLTVNDCSSRAPSSLQNRTECR
jgi:hypothetical protein